MWIWVAAQFSRDNLFQTLAFLSIFLICLPTFTLDRIARAFETHRRLRPQELARLAIESAASVHEVPPGQVSDEWLHEYNEARFIQKRTVIISRPALPSVRLHTARGESVAVFLVRDELYITRYNARHQPVVTYWVREDRLRDRLRALREEVAFSS